MPTPLATATCRRSATSPSLTSTIAVAPSSAARGPCPYGGSGRRCAVDHAPRRAEPARRARPARPRPSRAGRRTATTSPGRAPRPGHRRPALQVAERGHREHQHVRPRTTSPPTHRARRAARASARMPVGQLAPAQATGRSGGTAEPDAAARSARRPSPRRRRGSARRPCGRRRRRSTSPGGSAGPRRAGRSWSRPGRPAPRAPPRRRRGRAAGGPAAPAANRAVSRSISAELPDLGDGDGSRPLGDIVPRAAADGRFSTVPAIRPTKGSPWSRPTS